MKDAIIIGLCAIVLAGAGFGVGFATTKVDTAPLPAKLQQGLEKEGDKLSDAAKTDTSSSNLKVHNGLIYGGVGAVVGVIAGAGASVAMGKKK
jgi:hypothetical protein